MKKALVKMDFQGWPSWSYLLPADFQPVLSKEQSDGEMIGGFADTLIYSCMGQEKPQNHRGNLGKWKYSIADV